MHIRYSKSSTKSGSQGAAPSRPRQNKSPRAEDSSCRCWLANGDTLSCLLPGGDIPSIEAGRAATPVQFFLWNIAPSTVYPLQMALYRNIAHTLVVLFSICVLFKAFDASEKETVLVTGKAFDASEKETVLVTGGLGFIGSHVVEELVSRGFAGELAPMW
jgi:hypothetical protein